MSETVVITPPSAWYTDVAHHRAEARAVFGRQWLPLALTAELANTGDYVTRVVGDEPLVLVRSDDGVRGFFNVCRHHAGPVARGETGCVRRLQCPYHGWTYALDGALEVAPQMDGVEGFDRADHGLVPVRVERWSHWWWVCLDDAAPPLAETVAEIAEEVTAAGVDELAYFGRRVYDIDCDWKVFVDNFLDGGYHVPFLHRGLSAVLDNREYRVDVRERSVLQTAPVVPSDSAAGVVRQGDLARYWWLYPAFMINAYEGVMDTHLVLPLGPERCRVVCDYFFADVSEKNAEHNASSIAVAHRVQLEDVAISEAVQRGLRSSAYDRGPMNPVREMGAALFHRLVAADLQRINRA